VGLKRIGCEEIWFGFMWNRTEAIGRPLCMNTVTVSINDGEIPE
jgi:hypothetical protein